MATIVDGIKSTIAENFGGASHSAVDPQYQFSLDEVPDQTGKVAVITGGSEGIGYGCCVSFTPNYILLIQFHTSRVQ